MLSVDKVLKALPEIFSLQAHNDYQKLVSDDSVEEAMRQRWEALSNRLYDAVDTFEDEINGKKTVREKQEKIDKKTTP